MAIGTTELPLDLDDLLSLDSGPLSSIGAPPAPVVKDAPAAASGALISEAELADLFGLSSGRIRQLVADGVIQKTGRRFDRRDCTRSYTAWLRDKASRGVVVNDELKAEKIRQAREAADKLAIQNAASRGELLPAAEVLSTWAGIIRDLRAAMLSVPSRVAAARGHLTKSDIAAVDAEIRLVLAEASDG